MCASFFVAQARIRAVLLMMLKQYLPFILCRLSTMMVRSQYFPIIFPYVREFLIALEPHVKLSIGQLATTTKSLFRGLMHGCDLQITYDDFEIAAIAIDINNRMNQDQMLLKVTNRLTEWAKNISNCQ